MWLLLIDIFDEENHTKHHKKNHDSSSEDEDEDEGENKSKKDQMYLLWKKTFLSLFKTSFSSSWTRFESNLKSLLSIKFILFILGKPHSHGSSTGGSSSQRPSGQGNQGGCKNAVCSFISSINNVLSTFTAQTKRPNNE